MKAKEGDLIEEIKDKFTILSHPIFIKLINMRKEFKRVAVTL